MYASLTGKHHSYSHIPSFAHFIAGVEVAFLVKRPKKTIKLTIKLDGKDHEIEIDEGGAVHWSGQIKG